MHQLALATTDPDIADYFSNIPIGSPAIRPEPAPFRSTNPIRSRVPASWFP